MSANNGFTPNHLSLAHTPSGPRVAVLCGGVGAARLLRGLQQLIPADLLTAIVNVGDDCRLHGLHISPDIDTILYTLAGEASQERGWGLTGETWQAMTMLGRYGGEDWFSLGDRDLGTHLYRTHRLGQGATLAEVTAELGDAWDLPLSIIPATSDRLSTIMQTVTLGEISFQEYFVRHRHSVPVTGVRFDGASDARPAPGALQAIRSADLVIVAPSNPVVSIDPILALAELRTAVADHGNVVGISPLIGGKAIKGPAARLLSELGTEASATGVAAWYQGLVTTLVIDEDDAAEAEAIESLGIKPAMADIRIAVLSQSLRLSQFLLDCFI